MTADLVRQGHLATYTKRRFVKASALSFSACGSGASLNLPTPLIFSSPGLRPCAPLTEVCSDFDGSLHRNDVRLEGVELIALMKVALE
jgi:hypothetical protein